MTPRPRKRNNATLPPNLYANNGGKTFRYRHPVTGKYHGMGANKAEAIKAAKELNSLLVAGSPLVQGVIGNVSVKQHVDWFFENIIPEREYRHATLEMYRLHARKMVSAFGSMAIEDVTVQDMADLMDNQTPRISNQLRQVAGDIFKVAISRGLRDDNPAEMTLKRRTKKARRRLTYEEFVAVRALCEPWMQNAMDLALLTLQRRGDVSRLRFEDIKGKRLYVIQQKIQKHDAGYLSIGIGQALDQVIKRCRDDIASPYLVHRKPQRKLPRTEMTHWTQVTPGTLSRSFKAARDRCQLFDKVPVSERPTFHEIRALGIKLYRDQGVDPQQLAGHSSQKMTKNYEAGHKEIRWIEADANLSI
jgi:integrase